MKAIILELMDELNIQDVETKLAYQCAPLITCLKCSNLLILSSTSELCKIKKVLYQTGINIYVLYDEDKLIALLYKEKELLSYLKSCKVRELLYELGYCGMDLNKILFNIRRKYCDFIYTQSEFPHELGLLLEYPVEDVRGFIKKQGKQCLVSSYWKVYDNVTEKIELFHQYDLAKTILIELIAYGISMREIILSMQ